MHEMSVAESMMELVFESAASNRANRITRVEIVVGDLSGVAPDSLMFCFDALKSGTIAQDAVLVVEKIRSTAHCFSCADDFYAEPDEYFCRKCGGPVAKTGGTELSVRSIEIE
jgi:hydrogenase nickel incorporation protein HypA/HybF